MIEKLKFTKEDEKFTASFEPLPEETQRLLKELEAVEPTVLFIGDNRNLVQWKKQRLKKRMKSKRRRKQWYKDNPVQVQIFTELKKD